MRTARWLLLGVVLSLGVVGQVHAASKWVVKQSTPSPQGQWTLFDDGSVTRGDPKTTYDQQENCGHGKSDNCGGVLDITGWKFNGQGGGPHTDWKVEYLNPKRAKDTLDRVIITYDMTKGIATGAIREHIAVVNTMPDLSGMVLEGKVHVRADGTSQALYLNQDKTAQAVVDYDASGHFTKATTGQKEDLKLNKVTVPSYCSPRYGCMK